MPAYEMGTPTRERPTSPTLEASPSNMERIREEFYMCVGSRDPQATIGSAELARYWFALAETEQRRVGGHILGDPDKQVVALRAMQIVQEMDLTGTDSVGLSEWVHHTLMRSTQVSFLQATSQVDPLLRSVMVQHPSLLGDLQRIFSAADPRGEGTLHLQDIADTYRQKMWHFCPSHRHGLLSDVQLESRNPQALAQDIVAAMDLDGKEGISYAEFMVYCLGRRKSEVVLHFYDLTNGVASALSPWLLGKELEGLWHTGVHVFGKEYYFGGEIFYDVPGETAFGEPRKRVVIGTTLWRQEEMHNYIVDELRPHFNREVYDVVLNNCNHFADRLSQWLTGTRLPVEVVTQPESLMRLPVVKVLKPLLNRWLGDIGTGASAVGCLGEDPLSSTQRQVVTRRPPPEPGTLVGVVPEDGERQTILGIVCAPLARSAPASPKSGKASGTEAHQGNIWVHYLAVAPCCGDRGSRAALRTERFPRSRVVPTRLEDASSESLYLMALRAISASAPPLLSLTPKGSGTNRISGGASRGLKPTMSRPPGSMSMETPPGSPTSTPSCTPRRLSLGPDHEARGPSCTPGSAAPRGYTPRLKPPTLDDLTVPLEARLCLEFQEPRPRGSAGPRLASGCRKPPGAMVVDLHRRRQGKMSPQRRVVANL